MLVDGCSEWEEDALEVDDGCVPMDEAFSIEPDMAIIGWLDNCDCICGGPIDAPAKPSA